MKRRDPQSLSQIIDQAFDDIGMSREIAWQKACAIWPEIVGFGVNRMTMRRRVENGVLHVYLSSAVLKNELSFQRQNLIQAINNAVGSDAITDIKFH